jgi:hypothetical protein
VPSSIIIGQGGSGSGGSGGANASVGLNGGTGPTSSTQIGDIVAGVFTAFSATNPVPITGTIVASNPSVGATGVAAPAFATEIGVINASGQLVGSSASNPVRIDPTGTTVQPISGTITALQGTSPWVVSLASTTITGSVAVTGTFFQATQPVSGTITANQGTSPWVVSLASTTITGTVAVTQSTSPWIVAGGGTAGAPGTAVLTIQGITGGTAIPVSGTFFQALQNVNVTQWDSIALGAPSAYGTSPGAVNVIGVNAFITNTVPVTLASTTITGNVTVVQPTGTNLHVVIDSTTGTAAENLIQVAGVTLGATAVTAYGTAPAAANVPGVNAFITNTPAVTISTGAGAVTGTGSSLNVNVTNAAGPFTVTGNKTNNNAAPGNTNLGVLPALANAADPLWVEGDQVLLSENLTGYLRVSNRSVSGAVNDGFSNTQSSLADPVGSTIFSLSYSFLYNGTTWDRARDAAIGNNVAATGIQANAAYGEVTTAAPTYTTGTYSALSLDTSGNLRVTPTAVGTLTNNNAAPGTLNLGVLPALANAANPAWTEGNQVLLSEDLSGHLRVVATGAAAPGAAISGNPLLMAGAVHGTGVVRTISTDNFGGIDLGASSSTQSDGLSNNVLTLEQGGGVPIYIMNYPFLFNGTTWDRARSATIGNAVAATGIAATASYGEYLSAAPAPTTGQYSALQTDAYGCVITKHIRRSQIVRTATTIASSSAATTVIAAQAAGIFADLSALIISITPLTAGAVPISFTATVSDGTINYIYDLQATQLGTAVLVSNPTPPLNIAYNPSLPATTAATAWTVQLSVATVTVHITTLALLQKAN